MICKNLARRAWQVFCCTAVPHLALVHLCALAGAVELADVAHSDGLCQALLQPTEFQHYKLRGTDCTLLLQ